LTSARSRACATRYFLSFSFVAAALVVPKSAFAEKVVAKGDDWQVYTDGRVGGFFSWIYGQGIPQGTYESSVDSGGVVTCKQTSQVMGGGFGALIEQGPPGPPNGCTPQQGTINSQRIRSGFIGNQLGLGVRTQVSPWTTVTGYIQLWAYIESESRQKNRPNPVDVRQGYAKVESWWGSLLVGRTRALFSRGATDIDSLYAHRWGVGWVGGIDLNGPTLGQIGFGVMGSGFAAGVVYGTPLLLAGRLSWFRGVQLNLGGFEPIALYGNGTLTRTKYLRPEYELTIELGRDDAFKLVLFNNGVYQRAYKGGYTPPPSSSDPNNPPDPNVLGSQDTAWGVGAGLRLEIGRFHFGAAGHKGRGLGTNYALESTDASTDFTGNLREVDGAFLQGQVALGRFDLAGGWGINRIFLTAYDLEPARSGQMAHSVLKYQMGVNASVVYHIRPYLHLDLDYFRAQAKWFDWLDAQGKRFPGESQVVHATNAGMTFNW
jgi:hypothetical protein